MKQFTKLRFGTVAVCSVLASAALFSSKAYAGGYGENYIGQSYSLTWRFLDDPVEGEDYTIAGYACLWRDTLAAMSRTAEILHHSQ